jgi:radical SAM superfamily enzyme YgiQ (UPF0313 family)
MTYVGRMYRPPSEAHAFILQATVGCSWNACTYCDMYRDKEFRIKELAENLDALERAGAQADAGLVEKVFVADGDALILSTEDWLAILQKARAVFPALRQVSCYAMARNLLEKSPEELASLKAAGLDLLYIGPESGDDVTLKRIAKGDDFAAHVEAARRAHAAGMKLSVITLLGAGGVERSQEHAEATARLLSQMDPAYFSALTLTVIPGTPQAKLQEKGRFALPDIRGLFSELRTLVAETQCTQAVFRTNHASNYLPLGGTLPHDRDALLQIIDAALDGDIPLRPEWARGL